MLKFGGFMLILVLFLVCCTTDANNHTAVTNLNNTTIQEVSQSRRKVANSIAESTGVIVLSRNYGKNDFVRFYNDDGSIWYEFTFYYDDRDGKSEYANENFSPFSFHPDYFTLALKCVSEDNNRYEVIVNEDTGLRKFVRKDDPALKLESWEEHILKAFSINFNRNDNPLREEPDGKVKTKNLSDDVTFHPVEIKGEWIKVRYSNVNKSGKNDESSWIKWKKEGQILIELSYFS